MKNLAICLSGIPRGLYCVETIKKISKYNNTVLFIWYWKEEKKDSLASNSRRKSPYHEDFDPSIFDIENIKYFHDSELFDLKVPIFKEKKQKLKSKTIKDRDDLGIYGMTYGIMKANEMRENYERKNNMVFDCVMRARFELSFLKKGSTNYDENAVFRVEDFDMNKLWISHTNTDIKYGMNDCLAFSNSKIMTHYSNVYNRLDELSKLEAHSPEIVFHHNTKQFERHPQYVLVGF